jgi:hypothetical protein
MRSIVAPVQDGGVDELPEPVRRRLDEVFGEVLPSTTSDERDDRPDPRASDAELDAELLANRPPHHDQC